MSHLPAHQFLDDFAIPYRAQTFSPNTEKGAANVARALGFRERQIIKTLIFVDVKREEKVLVMLGGDQNAISGHLKKAIGLDHATSNWRLQMSSWPPRVMPSVPFPRFTGSRRGFARFSMPL